MAVTSEQVAIREREAAGCGRDFSAILQREPTLTEILEPFRQQVEDSGDTDASLDELIEEARSEAYLARQAAMA